MGQTDAKKIEFNTPSPTTRILGWSLQALLAAFSVAGSRLLFSFIIVILLAALYSTTVDLQQSPLSECTMVGGTLGTPIWAVLPPIVGNRRMALHAETMRNIVEEHPKASLRA